jgi:hypothetical protein
VPPEGWGGSISLAVGGGNPSPSATTVAAGSHPSAPASSRLAGSVPGCSAVFCPPAAGEGSGCRLDKMGQGISAQLFSHSSGWQCSLQVTPSRASPPLKQCWERFVQVIGGWAVVHGNSSFPPKLLLRHDLIVGRQDRQEAGLTSFP